jgi:hypothetical protein
MELPFAVESPSPADSSLHHSESSSLVTASSQGSFMNSSSPLVPNTPQDIVLPSPNHTQQHQHHHSNHHSRHQHQHHHHEGQLVVTPASEEFIDPDNDFTYVNVTETDADDDDILFEGADLTLQQDQTRGDVLAILLSGMQHGESNSLLVSLNREKRSLKKVYVCIKLLLILKAHVLTNIISPWNRMKQNLLTN